MAINTPDISTPNDGQGTDLRASFEIINANFTDSANMASRLAQTSPADATAGRGLLTDSIDPAGNVWGANNVSYVSDANGQTFKYPNGMMIVIKNLTGSASGFTNTLFTTAFVGGYGLSGVGTESSSTTEILIKTVAKTSGGFDFAIVGAGAFLAQTMDVTAIGRWK